MYQCHSYRKQLQTITEYAALRYQTAHVVRQTKPKLTSVTGQ